MTTYYVYWYRLPEHNYPYTQGYIGITNDLKRRHQQHTYSANQDNKYKLDTHFTRAISKYGSIDSLVKEVLYEGTFEEAYNLEYEYRPQLNLGWNVCTGGEHSGISIFKGTSNRWSAQQKEAIGKAHRGKTLSTEHIGALRSKNRASKSLGTAISLFHKDSYHILHTYHSISEASRQLNLPLSRLKSKNQSKVTSYGEDGWAVLFEPTFDRSTTLTGRQLAGIKQRGKEKPLLQGKNHWKNKTQVSSNEAD